MKKITAIALSLLAAPAMLGQQLPIYSSFFFTPQIVNPATSGADGFSTLTTMHRQQWQGMEGAPETSALVFNGAYNKERVGYSIYAYNDRTDIVNRAGIYGAYAYHVQLSETAKLSFGLGMGYVNTAIDMASVRVKDESDPFLIPANQNGTLDVSAGINFTAGDFQIGVSIPQLTAPTIIYSNNYDTIVGYRMLRHYTARTQYDFHIQRDRMILSPIVALRATAMITPQVDAGLMFNMPEYGYVGMMYRSNYAAVAQVGLHMTPLLSVGYAHDFSISDYASSLGISNEFLLAYRFGDNSRNKRLESELKRLKDKQRRAELEQEKFLNEKFDEFRDELETSQRAELDAQKKALEEQAAQQAQNMQMQPAGSQNGGVRGNQRGGTQQGTRSVTPSGGQVIDNGAITGYRAENYANNVVPGSSGYYVTAGVYGQVTNAERMVAKLSQSGIAARIFRDGGNGMYYVYLMQFNNYEAADRAKSSGLNGQYKGRLWIKIVR